MTKMTKFEVWWERVKFFAKLFWYSIWGWCVIGLTEEPDDPVLDKYGNGENTLYWAHICILYIDSTTKWYLVKKAVWLIKHRGNK